MVSVEIEQGFNNISYTIFPEQKGSLSGQPSPLRELLANTQQAAKQGPPLDNQGINLPHPQATMMDPMQNNMGGQLGPGQQPNVGLLGPGRANCFFFFCFIDHFHKCQYFSILLSVFKFAWLALPLSEKF